MRTHLGKIYLASTICVITCVVIIGAHLEHKNLHMQLAKESEELSDIINLNFLIKYSQLAASVSKISVVKKICTENTPEIHSRAIDILMGVASGANADLIYILDRKGKTLVSTILPKPA